MKKSDQSIHPGPEVIKHFNALSMKLIMLINAKVPTIEKQWKTDHI